jgi:pimeloyl-ACP methyl ester carboxylesterase
MDPAETRGSFKVGDLNSDVRGRLLTGLPVTDRRLEVAGVSTAMLEGGDGPPLVLLPAPGEFAAVWIRVIPDLVASHHVIAPDLPGSGASEMPDGRPVLDTVLRWLGELVSETCATPPVLVGHTAGGALAARFAVDHSDWLDRLVLVDSYGLARFRPAPKMALSFIRATVRPTERSVDRAFPALLRRPERGACRDGRAVGVAGRVRPGPFSDAERQSRWPQPRTEARVRDSAG